MLNTWFCLLLSGCIHMHAMARDIHVMDSVPQLSEIIITGKKKPVIQKKDTIVYRAEAFKTGTEKTLEDLLSRIPGITIDPHNGMLSYQGKTIQAVKLDGADLMGTDYVNLTRNISADLIDEIEAIDNDPDNPLLKEIRASGKQVLNLRLKKAKARSSGDIHLGQGIFSNGDNVSDAKANWLRLSRKVKSFVTSGFNNRGIHHSAYNYFDNQDRPQQQQDMSRVTPIISSFLQKLPIHTERYFINQNHMANGNILFQPVQAHHSVRLNVFGMRDQLLTRYHHLNQYQPDIKTPATTDDFDVNMCPVNLKAELEWKQFFGTKCWLRYTTIADYSNQTEALQHVINRGIHINGLLRQKNHYQDHRLELTYGMNTFMAFRLVFDFGMNDLTEKLSLNPESENDSMLVARQQHIDTRKKGISTKAVLSARKKNYEFEVEAGIIKSRIDFNASLSLFEDGSNNNSIQSYVQAYQSGSVTYRSGNWAVHSKLKTAVFDFKVAGAKEGRIANNQLIFEPELNFSRKISDHFKWNNVLSIQYRPLSERPFFENPMLVSARQLYVNTVRPQLQKSLKMQTMLIYHDLFRQQQLQFNVGYSRTTPFLAPVMNIDARSTQTSFTILYQPVKYYYIRSYAEKFLPIFNTTISLTNNYSFSNYYNLVNSNDVRNNTIHVFETGSNFKMALHKRFHVVYNVNMMYSRVHPSLPPYLTNAQLTESLQIIWQKPQIGFIRIITERFRPQLSSSYSIVFLDAQIQYKPGGKKHCFMLTAKNLLNQSVLRQIQIMDYGSTETQTRLLPGYVMIAWSYAF